MNNILKIRKLKKVKFFFNFFQINEKLNFNLNFNNIYFIKFNINKK